MNFCPKCGKSLVPSLDGLISYLHCDSCEFRFYREPKVSVLARIENESCLLFILRAVDPGLGKWCFPGGFLNFGETPEEALKREVFEETALDIQIKKILAVFPMEGRGPEVPGIVLAYSAICLGNPNKVKAGDDAADLRWCKPTDIPQDLAFNSTSLLIADWLKKMH